MTPEDYGNWLITLAYDGTAYHGWQQQPNMTTIQGTLNDSLEKLFESATTTYACSRTDAGVHALSQKVSYQPPPEPRIPAKSVHQALNSFMPVDIRVRSIEAKPPEFHARRNTVGKLYSYILANHELCSPFVGRYCWTPGSILDRQAMIAASRELIGTHDFTTFSANSRNKQPDYICKLSRIEFQDIGDFTIISVVGNRFLYKMVRRLIGFLVKVGQKRIAPDQTPQLLTARERNAGFETAPPQGLFLVRVFYDNNELVAYRPTQLPFLQFLGLPELL